MKILRKLYLLVGLLCLTSLPIDGKTLKEMMDWMHETRKVNFVYDASLDVSREYQGAALEKLSTKKALQQLFNGTGIIYQIKGNYIILKVKKQYPNIDSQTHENSVIKQRRNHTLSGFIRNEHGEPLLNATVYDLTHGVGTTTNEHGFFSLTLPKGDHQLRYSYIGYAEKVERLNLQKDHHHDIALSIDNNLPEIVVTGDLNSPLLTTQTGKRSLSQKDIMTEYALLSSPDLVKTLQKSSGVAEGLELMSGMYVHGGNGDENLFLLDGTPLYDINHAIGLFSSFNPDVVKNVDFYKSGFPARYSGRLSSVVDVRTKDGDMDHLHGSYRIGMIDAGVHLEGPIQKGKTSYNIGLRRSYSDLIMPLISWKEYGEDTSISYHFTDFNAKVSHYFSLRSKLALSFYCGKDVFQIKDKYKREYSNINDEEGHGHNKLNWGNFNVSLDWSYQFSPRLFADFTAVYTYNRSKLHGQEDQSYWEDSDKNIYHHEHSYDNTINDMGYRMAFDFRPNPRHHIRFGQDYTCHIFQPQTMSQFSYEGNSVAPLDTTQTQSHNRHQGHELSAYAEDEIQLGDHWSLNAGFHANLFSISGKTFMSVDPRLSAKYQLSNTISLKASFTRMTQYMHKLSNTYLSLPTDYWVPTTNRLKPMYAWQVAAGIYCQPNQHWTLSLEGYYKQSHHILQYSSWYGLEPPAARWDQRVMDGEGRFYGLELDGTYHTQRLQLTGSYTLSWNKRRCEEFYAYWFYDKFDNRHKINLSLRYLIGKKSSMYAAWSYHSGYHTTVPNQIVALPEFPGSDGKYDQNWSDNVTLVHTKPNNVALPNYHRLDIGFNFRHTTKKHHHERIWNLSVFNVYCRRNAFYMNVKYDYANERYRAHTVSVIPMLLPSCSYTIKF